MDTKESKEYNVMNPLNIFGDARISLDIDTILAEGSTEGSAVAVLHCLTCNSSTAIGSNLYGNIIKQVESAPAHLVHNQYIATNNCGCMGDDPAPFFVIATQE